MVLISVCLTIHELQKSRSDPQAKFEAQAVTVASKLDFQVAWKLGLGQLQPPASFEGRGQTVKPSFELGQPCRAQALRLGYGGL
ncbi:Protein kinase domain-containing protein [Psidium guajava]|nr:Protein kinase domain-containing protein [Psidium guajava]